jgi:hypothetical protein
MYNRRVSLQYAGIGTWAPLDWREIKQTLRIIWPRSRYAPQ